MQEKSQPKWAAVKITKEKLNNKVDMHEPTIKTVGVVEPMQKNQLGGIKLCFPVFPSSLEKVAELQVKIKGKGWKMIELESHESGVIETRS